MFGFGNRKSPANIIPDRNRVVGIDLTSSRARAVSLAAGRTRPLILDEPLEDLLMYLHLDRRAPDVGMCGYHVCRKFPHTVCTNFLAQLGQPQHWRGPRSTVTPESALQSAFEKIRGPVVSETDSAGLSMPGYLSASQVKSALELANRAKLPIRGSVSTHLAVCAHRAAWVLGSSNQTPLEDEMRPDWVVSMNRPPSGPTTVIVVDVDEFALSASIIEIDVHEVKTLATAAWPRLSLKAWKDRLLDALADRCVRLCRRDPRDSADAEQALFEQLEHALERTSLGQSATLTVRSAHWYQDLVNRPEDFDSYCANLARTGAEGIRDLARSVNTALPPRAVWLTHAAARLPGLAAVFHLNSPEQTEVMALPVHAVADACAYLVPFWLTGMIPRIHLDTVIPLPPLGRENKTNPALPKSSAPTL